MCTPDPCGLPKNDTGPHARQGRLRSCPLAVSSVVTFDMPSQSIPHFLYETLLALTLQFSDAVRVASILERSCKKLPPILRQ